MVHRQKNQFQNQNVDVINKTEKKPKTKKIKSTFQ